MAEHRDSPEIEPELAGEARTTASRRFARMVESPAARRVALPRLLLAVGLLLGLLVLGFVGGSRLVNSVMAWVASRPEHQLPFSKIELVPSPDPWVFGGRLRILEQVRDEAKHGEVLSLLELDLKSLEKDFRRCPLVKDVILVDRSQYGRLIVHLVYRKPVAVVVLDSKKDNGNTYVIDEEAVPLPPRDVDWTDTGPRFQVRGNPDPLIEIRGVKSSTEPEFGVPWKRSDGERDPMILGAALLAEFLQGRQKPNPSRPNAPSFARIYLLDEPINWFLLCDSRQNWVQWGKAPGEEKPGELSAEDRWKMLLDSVDRDGPLNAKYPNFLQFTRSGLEKGTFRNRK